MNGQIASLSSEQAQRAVLAFYDLMPGEIWKDGTKPSVARLETLAGRLQEHAPDEIQTVLKALRGEGDLELKGEVAIFLLESFAQHESLRPYVEQALLKIAQPHMAIDPVSIGIIVTLLAAFSSTIHFKGTSKDKKIEIILDGKAPELIEAFTGFVKVLPKKILEKLT